MRQADYDTLAAAWPSPGCSRPRLITAQDTPQQQDKETHQGVSMCHRHHAEAVWCEDCEHSKIPVWTVEYRF